MSNTRAFEMDLDISGSEFSTIVHAVAANENRKQFARRSIYTDESQAKSNNGVEQSDGKYRLEKGFLGAHSDIGGGYESGDLSNVALMWMIKQAKEKGNIKFKDYSQYNQVNNPIVHDSLWSFPLFSAGGEFRWATDDSKDKSDVSIFNNFTHLGLNWRDTELFQNPNNQKFTDIRKRYAPLIEKDKSPTKGSNMTEGSVLMANEDGKRVAIKDYLTWLECSYDLNISLGKELEKGKNLSKYTKKELCNGRPLQSLLPVQKQGVNGWGLLLLALLGISGCVTNLPNKKTNLHIKFRMSDGTTWKPGDEQPEIDWETVVKMDKTELKYCNINHRKQFDYISWDIDCENNIQNQSTLTVQYATIIWETKKARAVGTDNYRNQQANKLPPSAWRTYTIYPKQLLEKGQSVPPSNKPASQKPQHLRTTVTVILYIDGNSNISQEIKREYVKIGNPYA